MRDTLYCAFPITCIWYVSVEPGAAFLLTNQGEGHDLAYQLTCSIMYPRNYSCVSINKIQIWYSSILSQYVCANACIHLSVCVCVCVLITDSASARHEAYWRAKDPNSINHSGSLKRIESPSSSNPVVVIFCDPWQEKLKTPAAAVL